MNKISYSGYRFPPEIIHQAIWLYLRFTLSLRDFEDLLAERGVAVSYETVRRRPETGRADLLPRHPTRLAHTPAGRGAYRERFSPWVETPHSGYAAGA